MPFFENVRKILLPRFDTIGDLVLLEPFLRALQEVFKGAQITLLVREGYLQLAPLFPRQLHWQVSGINPYSYPIDPVAIRNFLSTLGKEDWDLVLFTKYECTWLEHLIGAMLKNVRRIAVSPSKEGPKWLNRYSHYLGIDLQCHYDELVSVEERAHETEKYRVLLNYIGGEKRSLLKPKLTVPDQIKRDSRAILQALRLNSKKFCVCLPGGTENITIKRWPASEFSKVIAWLKHKHAIETLLVGHENERGIVEEVETLVRGKGYSPPIWLGKQGEIPLLAGLLQRAKLYFGNDTGPMHMSAALSIPVVALFGGGTWPRFLPKGSEGHAVVRSMACFYCGWKCSFGDAPCVKNLPRSLVQEALETVVSKDKSARGKISIHEAAPYPPITNEFIRTAGKTSKRNEADREARLEVIYEREWRIREIEEDRDAKLKLIDDLRRHLEQSEIDKTAALRNLKHLEERFEKSEENRATHLKVIDDLRRHLEQSEIDKTAALKNLKHLEERFEKSEENRATHLEVIRDQERQIQKFEEDRLTSFKAMENIEKRLEEVEADRAARLVTINEQIKLIEVQRAELIKSSLIWKMTGSRRRPLKK